MTEYVHKGVEQIAIKRWLDNAYKTFDQQLLSISGRIVLWGSVGSKDELRDRYLINKGKKHLLDRRRRQTPSEECEWIGVDNAAEDAWAYLQWARSHAGQPIARESLVTYFTAFENCLKSIATAFSVATDRQVMGDEDQFFVPLTTLSRARRKIGEKWKSREYGEGPKGGLFFEGEIVKKNPFPTSYVFNPISPDVWGRIGAAYTARNAIVHAMGLVAEQFDFGGRSLYPGDEIEVTDASLREIAEDFRKILDPFNPEITMKDL